PSLPASHWLSPALFAADGPHQLVPAQSKGREGDPAGLALVHALVGHQPQVDPAADDLQHRRKRQPTGRKRFAPPARRAAHQRPHHAVCMVRANGPGSTNNQSRAISRPSNNPLHAPAIRCAPPVKVLLPLLANPERRLLPLAAQPLEGTDVACLAEESWLVASLIRLYS